MERHWNVLKFTCGLMDDSSLLIESICQTFAKIITRRKPRESFGSLYGSLYLTDINREKSARSLSPFNNAQVSYNSLGYIPTNHRLFYLNGWDINQMEEITMKNFERHGAYKKSSEGNNLSPCSVIIHQGKQIPIEYFFMVCSSIRQPIEHFLIYGQENLSIRLKDFAPTRLRTETSTLAFPCANTRFGTLSTRNFAPTRLRTKTSTLAFPCAAISAQAYLGEPHESISQ